MSKNKPRDTFQLVATRPDGDQRRIARATVVEGVVAQVRSRGVGEAEWKFDGVDDVYPEYERYEECLKPIWSRARIERAGLDEKSFAEETADLSFEEARRLYPHLMFKMSFNEDIGWLLETEEEHQARKQEEKESKLYNGDLVVEFRCESRPHTEDLSGVFLNSPAPKGGAFLTGTRIPKEVWTRIKRDGNCYHYSAEMLDEFDMFTSPPGWRYTASALETLLDAGLRVSVDGVEISSISGITEALDEGARRRAAAREEARAREAVRGALRAEIRELFRGGGAEMPRDCSEVEGTTKLTVPDLGITGATAYGGGEWFHLTDTHFWHVQDNGADGDFWGANNYRTGGAGAIARRVERTPAVEDLYGRLFED